MSAAHTPGPWQAKHYKHWRRSDDWLVRGPNNEHVADVHGDESGHGSMGEANARLIAAAPQLAEVLRALVNNAARHTDAVHIVPSHVVERARAALTAAGVTP